MVPERKNLDIPPLKGSLDDLAFRYLIDDIWINGDNTFGMREVWDCTLSWLTKPPRDAKLRAGQLVIIEAIKNQLENLQSVEELRIAYSQDMGWSVQIAESTLPGLWTGMNFRTVRGAAYGLRYVEMLTGRKIDATKPLPKWIGEWAIW